jgi:predicted DNA-binding WGR domain protein
MKKSRMAWMIYLKKRLSRRRLNGGRPSECAPHKNKEICEKNDCHWGSTGKCSKKRETKALLPMAPQASLTPVEVSAPPKSAKAKVKLTPVEKPSGRVPQSFSGRLVHLENQEGTSNKFYNLEITETPKGYLLDQSWGPIGKEPRRHKDWPRPEDYYPTYAAAHEALEETLASKLKKGYHYA